MRSNALRLLLALALLLGSAAAGLGTLPPAFADQRPGDTVNGTPIGDLVPPAEDLPSITASYASICTGGGTVLWERDANTQTPMASTTKIMTALIALENSAPETPMMVTVGASTTDGSTAGLEAGQTLTLHDLLYALMLPSGNDAAVVIAENIAGTTFSFVDLMNEKAKALGMANTHFADVHGLSDEDHYTTANDFLILTRAAMQEPLFREVVGTREITVVIDGEEVKWESTNLLFDLMPNATGVKTGFTDLAGYCFVGTAQRNGIELYAVIFHDTVDDPQPRFDDAAALLEWGFRHYRRVELINTKQLVGTMALTSWLDKNVEAYVPATINLELFDLDGPISQEILLEDWEGAVRKGAICGSIIWSQNGEVLATSDLMAAQSVPEPSFFEGLSISWTRFWGNLFGNLEVQKTEITLSDTLTLPMIPPPSSEPQE